MNSIDDFTIAMHMYTYANKPVSSGKYTSIHEQYRRLYNSYEHVHIHKQACVQRFVLVLINEVYLPNLHGILSRFCVRVVLIVHSEHQMFSEMFFLWVTWDDSWEFRMFLITIGSCMLAF